MTTLAQFGMRDMPPTIPEGGLNQLAPLSCDVSGGVMEDIETEVPHLDVHSLLYHSPCPPPPPATCSSPLFSPSCSLSTLSHLKSVSRTPLDRPVSCIVSPFVLFRRTGTEPSCLAGCHPCMPPGCRCTLKISR
jgi:hypothetical protein